MDSNNDMTPGSPAESSVGNNNHEFVQSAPLDDPFVVGPALGSGKVSLAFPAVTGNDAHQFASSIPLAGKPPTPSQFGVPLSTDQIGIPPSINQFGVPPTNIPFVDNTQLPFPGATLLPTPPSLIPVNMQFIARAFARIYNACRVNLGPRIKKIALPVAKANGVVVHEAHCFGLGSFRDVQYWHWENEAVTMTRQELMTRAQADPNVAVMVRYSSMLFYFQLLSINGVTGWGERNEARGFVVRFTDPRLGDEEMAILNHASRVVLDRKNGVAVKVAVIPATAMYQPNPVGVVSQGEGAGGVIVGAGGQKQAGVSPPGHEEGCNCSYEFVKHFVYVAQTGFPVLHPALCPLSRQPAFFLGADRADDGKHKEGCSQAVIGRDIMVPRVTDSIIGCQIWVPGAIPPFLRVPWGYLKFCLDIRNLMAPRGAIDAMSVWMRFVLPNADALYIRQDIFLGAEEGKDYL